MCRNGTECSLRNPRNPNITCTGEPDWAIVGTWVQDDTSSLFKLVGCPAGHELVGSEGGDDVLEELQECKKCSSSQYVINPNNHKCKTCPKGLACRGTAEYTPRVIGSTWVVDDGGVLKLQTCPAGYLKVAPEDLKYSADQECVVCDAGKECVQQPCVECVPCKPGYYKSSAGTQLCIPCPAGTYNDKTGAMSKSDCQSCPAGATTDQEGSSTSTDCKCNSQKVYAGRNSRGKPECKACPEGAVCPDGGCGFYHSTGRPSCPGSSFQPIGTWTLDANGDYKLTACPSGYKNQRAPMKCVQCEVCSTADDDGWCSRADYILNSNSTDSACQVCPEGAECNGASLRTKNNLQGATWVIEGDRYSLKSCPTGHRIVNNLGYENQKCEPCGASEYILKSDDPSYQCLPCPVR